MKQFLIIIFAVIQNFGNAQNFQKIYMFQDSASFINDIFVTDSCYYFQGTTAFGSQRCDVVYGRISLNGDVVNSTRDVTANEYNQSYGGLTQLDTNYRGNFIISYTNRIFIGSEVFIKPNITEISKNGSVITNHNYFVTDSLDFTDFGRTISLNDSSYLSVFSYRYTGQTNTQSSNNESGVLMFKSSIDHDTIWTKRFHAIGSGFDKPQWSIADISLLEDNTILVMVREYQQASIPNIMARIHFIKVSQNGEIIDQHVFQETTVTYAGFSFLPLTDGSLIVQYYDSRLITENSGAISREYRACLGKLNSNFQQVWKDTLGEIFHPNLGATKAPMKLIVLNDSVFAGSNTNTFSTMYDSAQWNTLRVFEQVRIFNKTVDGETLWNRDYFYWQPSDSINDPYYILWDFEKTPDGGFITAGNAFNTDSIIAGKKGQFGYILKTNCLGYLAPPIAEFSYSNTSDLTINILNTSIQSGSFVWDFGDGTQLETDEYTTNIQHTYSNYGLFELTLIAKGCNGERDTISSLINIENIPIDTTIYVGDGTLLTLYPNPCLQGENLGVFVGGISDESTTLEIFDFNGKVVFSELIPKGNSNYLIPIKFSVGYYLIALKTNNKIVETEKLLVR